VNEGSQLSALQVEATRDDLVLEGRGRNGAMATTKARIRALAKLNHIIINMNAPNKQKEGERECYCQIVENIPRCFDDWRRGKNKREINESSVE